MISESIMMPSYPINALRLGLQSYFDAPGLPLYKALESVLMMFKEFELDPDRYKIETGDSSRSLHRPSGQIFSCEEVLEEIRKDDAITFFVHPIRVGSEREQVIHLSPPFARSPFQGFVVSPSPGLGIQAFRKLLENTSYLANLGFAGINEGGYLEWQRCDDPDRYARVYGSLSGFKINERQDLPSPLNRQLDISKNPGRISSVNKLPVCVAADMWLGPAFWKYAPCTKEEVLKEPWVEVEDTEHYLYLKAYPEPFTRPDGEQGCIQRRIWNVLFHQDCEWPPGSGTIAEA